MPFSEFGRPKADLDIRLNKASLRAGEELDARVELMPREDFHVRLGKVELVSVETCVQVVRSQHGVSYHEKKHNSSVAEETFMENRTVRKMAGASTNVRFTLPQDALPTLNATPVNKILPGISWEIKASLDVSRARDLSEAHEIVVARPLERDQVAPEAVVEEAEHGQCNLVLSLLQSEARSDSRLDGSLRAKMSSDMNPSEVRVELVRVEKFGNEAQDHIVSNTVLEQGPTLKSGQTREWRFQLDVGQVNVPSLRAENASVRWLVKGIFNLRMRRDLRVEREIHVDF